jgi:uncharacterized tellurite resistance protein B-like protein
MNAALKSHFLNLYSMALADTEFDESEIAILYKIASNRGIERSEIDSIILNPATAKFTLPNGINEKIEYLYDYARMILADGKIEDYEIKTLEKFCRKFEFQEENITSIIEFLMEAAKNNIPTSDIINFVTQSV